MLQGDLPRVNPSDNDDVHLADHERRLKMAGENTPAAVLEAMAKHMQDHVVQRGRKTLMVGMVSKVADQLAPLVAGAAPAAGPQFEQPKKPSGGGIMGRVQSAIEGM